MFAKIRSVPNTLKYIFQHPIGRRKPLLTLARIAKWQVNSVFRSGLHPHDWVADSRLLAEKGMLGVTGNLYFGFHEFVEMSFVSMVLKTGDLFADIGANAGSYTVLASKVAGANTIAFEPGDAIYPILKRQLELNGIEALVHLRREAVGAKKGRIGFSTNLGTMNHIIENGAIEMVDITTIDIAFADRSPFAIKLDIEGAEDKAIAGAQKVLQSPEFQFLIIETVSPDAEQIITSAGLREIAFDPFCRSVEYGVPKISANNRIFARDLGLIRERLSEAPPITVAGITL